jgi:hypothetical protein
VVSPTGWIARPLEADEEAEDDADEVVELDPLLTLKEVVEVEEELEVEVVDPPAWSALMRSEARSACQGRQG